MPKVLPQTIAGRPRRAARVPAALHAAALLILLLGPALAEDWRRYINPRFGFSVELPFDRFSLEVESGSGDGASFVSPAEQARIAAWGGYIAPVADSFADYRDWLLAGEEARGLEVTYTAGGKGWFVYSGIADGMIVYQKVIAACPDRSVAQHLRFDYPLSRKAAFDALVTRASRSLRSETSAPC